MRYLFAGATAFACSMVFLLSDGPVGAVRAASGQSAREPSEFGDMFVAQGVEETFYACTACHSEKIVVQQGLSREAWDELFDWMIEEQGMDEIEPEERRIILDYLAAHYNEDRPNFPKRAN